MAGYIGSKASVVSSGAERKKTFAITTTTTALTGLVYTPTKVHVFHNGVRLVDGTDFTATNSTSITLTVAAESGDQVVVVSYATFQVADAYTQTEADAEFVAKAGDTMTGPLSVTGTVTADGLTSASVLTLSSAFSSGSLGGIIRLADAGTQFGDLHEDSGNFLISSAQVDKDIIFKGNDGGGVIEAMRIDMSGGGNVGIGTAVPETTLEIKSTGASIAGLNGHILVSDETAVAANVGGGVLLEGNYTTAGDDAVFGAIKGLKENGTSGNYAGALAFYSRPHGGLATERMRIDAVGRVTTPYQPSFMATAPTGYNTDGYLNSFNPVRHNVGNHFNNSTGYFTAPVAGTYLFIAGVLVETGTGRLEYVIKKNGSTVVNSNGTGTTYDGPTLSAFVEMSANDTARIERQSGTAYSDGSHENTYFGGHLIG
jgi:phage baseplate assembly protein gpV